MHFTYSKWNAEVKHCYVLYCTYLPTRNMQRPVSKNAMRRPTHMSVEKGDKRLKVLSSEATSLCRIKPMPVCMKGVVMSTNCSLTAVRVSEATARSASWWMELAHINSKKFLTHSCSVGSLELKKQAHGRETCTQ